jgi:transcriptional regulator with XRE-family HTH domain
VTLQHPTFGELLKQSRRAAGLTQEMLAARAGLSARAISDLERNVKHVPRAGTVQLLLGALPLSPQERQFFQTVAGGSWGTSSANVDDSPTDVRQPQSLAPEERAAARSDRWPPLVGRASEQALLQRHLGGDGPALLMLGGEPGIGKTRLLEEATVLAEARGMNVLHGTVMADGHHSPRDPLREALRQQIQKRSPVQLRQDLAGCAWLVRVLPELASGPIEPLPSLSVDQEQAAALTAEAMFRFLSNVAGPAGTLLTLDNLQHADTGALELVARLVRCASGPPLRIVGAYRDSESTRGHGLSTMLARLAQEQLVTHITVPPLRLEHAAKLLAVLVNDKPGAAAGWRDNVAHQTGGVPFYLTAWIQDMRLRRLETPDNEVPWVIRQSVGYRIDVAPGVRALLETIAVAGGRATYALLAAVAASSDEEACVALEAACKERLLLEESQAYRFTYDVIQRVIEADLSPTRRMRLRQRLAAVVHQLQATGALATGESAAGPDAGRREQPARPSGAASVRSPSELDERAHHLAVLRRHRRATS